MARVYKRDSKGRFAGGGGGGGKKSSGSGKSNSATKKPGKWSKMMADAAGGGAASKKKNAAANQSMVDKGITGVGSRLRSKTESRFAGRAKTKRNNADTWVSGAKARSKAKAPSGTIKRKR